MSDITCSVHANKCKRKYLFCEEDFYPPEDVRVLRSYICDIKNGDNFEDFAKYIFKLYEQVDWYEN